MGQDLRNMFSEVEEKRDSKLSKGHEKRFLDRLEDEFPEKKKSYSFLKIAAAVALMLSLGILTFKFVGNKEGTEIVKVKKEINSIADISPDLKQVENYYLTNINYQLSKIKVTETNKEILEVYFSQLGELQKEYEQLNEQLKGDEISEETIEKLIENLQMRVLLLKQLKSKLNKIEKLNSKQNEKINA